MFDSYSAEAQGGMVVNSEEKQEKNKSEKLMQEQTDPGLTGQAKVGVVSILALLFGILVFAGFLLLSRI